MKTNSTPSAPTPAAEEQGGLWDKLKQHASVFFAVTLVASDVTMTGLAFYLAYMLRLHSEYQNISPTFTT